MARRLLSKKAFLRYAPKEMHTLINGFDTNLQELIESDPEVCVPLLERANDAYTTKELIPYFTLVALKRLDGGWDFGVVPMEHYRTDRHAQIQRGKWALSSDYMKPTLIVEAITDPALAAMFGSGRPVTMERYAEVAKSMITPSQILTIPLGMVLEKSFKRYERKRFTLYQHFFGTGEEHPNSGPFYIGITSRDWKTRWAEHKAAIKRGSNLKFHRVYRERAAAGRLTFENHRVVAVASTLDEIQDFEEGHVASRWGNKRLMNMIPGGKARE